MNNINTPAVIIQISENNAIKQQWKNIRKLR